MRNVIDYSEFDHKKVMSILFDLKRRVNLKAKIKGAYQVIIETYEEDLVQKNTDWLNDADDDDKFTFVLCKFSLWYYTEHNTMTNVFDLEIYEEGILFVKFNIVQDFFSLHINSNKKKITSEVKHFLRFLGEDSYITSADNLGEGQSMYDLLKNVVKVTYSLTGL